MPQLQCEEIRFPSADGVHTVAASMYTMPGVPVRAVLQLSHGMCEYVQRYRPMAQWYAQRGIALAGNDHLGHGGTANKGEHGHYGEPRGRYHLLNDLHTMNGIIHQKFPGVPVFLYGHSMGSFYARWYAETWPESISGAIFSGTAGPHIRNQAGWAVAALTAAVRGPKYVSKTLVKLNMGAYCNRIPDAVSPNAWISRDPEVVKAYDAAGVIGEGTHERFIIDNERFLAKAEAKKN